MALTTRRRWRRKALLAKIEGTYGTDATPAGGTDAILARSVEIVPIEGTDLDRALDLPWLGNQGTILVEAHVSLTFEVEIAGAGAAGDAPGWGPLMRACGLSETVEEEESVPVAVAYAPVSDAFESVTIALSIDGTLHKVLGARGNVQATVDASGLPVWRYSFLGLLVVPTAAANPVVDVAHFQRPLPVSDANTSFTLGGLALPMASFSLDLGNDVGGEFLVNSESIEISDRSASAQLEVSAPPMADFNPFALAIAKTPQAIAIVHGTAAGNIVEISAPKAVLRRPGYTNTRGVIRYSLPVDLVPDAGNDELVITVR